MTPLQNNVKKIECNLKDVKCAGEKSINKCGDDGQWNTTSCNNDGVCVHTDNGDECTECIPNTASCDGNTLKLCNPKGKLSVKSCPSEKPFCVNKTCVECKGNDEKCEGNIHKQCENGEWKTELCAHGCDNNKCASQCVDHCDDNTPHVCSNNIAQKKCDEGKTCRVIDHKAICTECNPDDPNARSRCYPSNTGFDTSVGQYQVCENGMWSTPKTCTGDTRICAELGCGSAQQCEAEKTKCERGDFKVCRENQWITYQTCEYGCDDESGCYECREGQSRCDGNIIQVCNSGQWSSSGATNCEENNLVCVDIAVGEADCKVCNLNVSECDFSIDTEDGVGYYKTCDNNYSWIMQQLCSLDVSVCKDNNQCVCHTGDAICVNNSLNIGIKSICGSSDSSSERQCDGQVSCKGNQCGECLNGTTQCENNEHNIGIVQTCKNGIWDPNEDDPCDDLSCNIDGTDCGECLNGSFKCDGNSPKKCNNGQWESFGVSCNVYGSSCMIINEGTVGEIAKCAFCKPGISQCVEDNKAYRVCNADGNWDDPLDCPNGCDPSTGECMDGPNRCDATKLTISADGFKYDGNLISDWSLECDNTKGLLIKDLGICTGEILLSPGGNCFELPYTATLSYSIMMDVRYIMLCNELQFDPFGLSNYVLTFSRAASGNSIKVETCDGDCNGNFCLNQHIDNTCECNDETIGSFMSCCRDGNPYVCLNGELKLCNGTDLCSSVCTEKCSGAGNSITISDQLITRCLNGVKTKYSMFTYACFQRSLNIFSGDTALDIILTPNGTEGINCTSLLNQEYSYPQSPVASTTISGSGTICAAAYNLVEGEGITFTFNDSATNRSVRSSGSCAVCKDYSSCTDDSGCHGGICVGTKNKKCLCGFKTQQCLLESGNSKCIGFNSDGDICNGSCKDSDCVCEATM